MSKKEYKRVTTHTLKEMKTQQRENFDVNWI